MPSRLDKCLDQQPMVTVVALNVFGMFCVFQLFLVFRWFLAQQYSIVNQELTWFPLLTSASFPPNTADTLAAEFGIYGGLLLYLMLNVSLIALCCCSYRQLYFFFTSEL